MFDNIWHKLKNYYKPDNPYVYIFVRQNLPLAQQLVQACHASVALSQLDFDLSKIPHLSLIGVENKEELESVINKLMGYSIGFTPFYEPDNEEGLTAIATIPIYNDKRKYLKDYNLWRPDNDSKD